MFYLSIIHSLCFFSSFWFFVLSFLTPFPNQANKQNKHHHVLLLLFFFPLPSKQASQPTNRLPCCAIIAKETGQASRLLPSPFKTAK
jgi:hypothetical protein